MFCQDRVPRLLGYYSLLYGCDGTFPLARPSLTVLPELTFACHDITFSWVRIVPLKETRVLRLLLYSLILSCNGKGWLCGTVNQIILHTSISCLGHRSKLTGSDLKAIGRMGLVVVRCNGWELFGRWSGTTSCCSTLCHFIPSWCHSRAHLLNTIVAAVTNISYCTSREQEFLLLNWRNSWSEVVTKDADSATLYLLLPIFASLCILIANMAQDIGTIVLECHSVACKFVYICTRLLGHAWSMRFHWRAWARCRNHSCIILSIMIAVVAWALQCISSIHILSTCVVFLVLSRHDHRWEVFCHLYFRSNYIKKVVLKL